MKKFLVLMCVCASMAAVYAFDYFSFGATFDPTWNYGRSNLYSNEDRIGSTNNNWTTIRYNTISAGVELGFGTIDQSLGKKDDDTPRSHLMTTGSLITPSLSYTQERQVEQ